MENEVLIQGLVKVINEYDSGDGVYVGEEPLSEQVLFMNGKIVNVSFFISENERSLDELKENLILTLVGDLDADYGDAYSDYTGYLWTDDKLKIGNHDLLNDISMHKGKFATILIKY